MELNPCMYIKLQQLKLDEETVSIADQLRTQFNWMRHLFKNVNYMCIKARFQE